MSYFRKMIAAVGDLDFTGDPVDDFADGAFALLAAALARLPEWKRELYFSAIERGDLLRAMHMFEQARPAPYPKIANGNGHDAH
jgi:hypothetical protein